MHSFPGGPRGGIAAGGGGLRTPCNSVSSGRCSETCRHYNGGSTPLTVPCEGTGESGGSEMGRGASRTRVGWGSAGRPGRRGPPGGKMSSEAPPSHAP